MAQREEETVMLDRNVGLAQELNLSGPEREMEERDYRDMHRETAPLRQAEDAVLEDSSDMTIQEAVDRIVELVKERRVWK